MLDKVRESAVTPRKPGQEILSLERVVDAALALVDEEGTDALSMRRLGSALGVDASTIYYHVPNKSALEDLVVDAVMGQVSLSATQPLPTPVDRIMFAIGAFAEALLMHPRALPLFASRSLTSPVSLRPIEYLLDALADAGLDPSRALAAVNAIAFYVLGATTAFAAGLLDAEHEAQAVASLGSLPADEYPRLLEAIAHPGLLDKRQEFEMGAHALVSGLLASATNR